MTVFSTRYFYSRPRVGATCPYRTWPVTIADRIRSMTDNELAGVLCNFRMDIIVKELSGVSTMPEDWHEIKKWLESPWEGKP